MVELSWGLFAVLSIEMGGIDPIDMSLTIAVHSCMLESLGDTHVGILARDEVTDQCDRSTLFRHFLTVSEAQPGFPHDGAICNALGGNVGRNWKKIELFADYINEILLSKEHRDVVGCRDIVHAKYFLWLL
jgi:hypothetical protein